MIAQSKNFHRNLRTAPLQMPIPRNTKKHQRAAGTSFEKNDTAAAAQNKLMAKDKQRRETFDPAKVLTGHGAGQSRLRLAPEQMIYSQGDPADSLFYIESGRVKITVVSPAGKEAVIAIRSEGEFFGELCLINRQRRIATTTTLNDCSIVSVAKAAMMRLLRQDPDFAEMFVTYLVRQRAGEVESLIDQLTNSAEKRLARVMLQLAAGGDDPQPMSIRISQAVLANMVGTTRSRVNFFMNKFKRQGLIEYNRDGYVSVRKALLRALLEA
ncbi:MAG: Crp/Fnr family transcriptional regulator [Candidatus Binataceae bacterium]